MKVRLPAAAGRMEHLIVRVYVDGVLLTADVIHTRPVPMASTATIVEVDVEAIIHPVEYHPITWTDR